MTSRHGDTLPVAEISILWLTAGLGCDGDTIAMTAATQPSIEDLLSGALPWTPKVKLHNPFLATEVGDEFVRVLPSGRARRARIRSSWWSKARFPTRPTRPKATGPRSAPIPRPASRSPPANGSTGSRPRPGRSSRPAPAPRTAASTPWRAIPPAAWACPTTSAGSGARRPGSRIVCLPGLSGAAGQHDRDAALPAAPGRRARAADSRSTRRCARAGCSSRRCTRGATAAATTSRASSPTSTARRSCIVKLGCWGPVVQCNVGKRGWMGGIGGCPNVGGICIGCTMPGFPGQVPCRSWTSRRARCSRPPRCMTYGRAIQALRRFTQAR